MAWIGTSVALLLTSAALFAWMRWITLPRLELPLSVAVSGRFELPVRIPVSDRYFLYLYFNREDASFETLRTLIGGAHGQKIEVDGKLIDAGEPSGLPIPLRWWLRRAESGLLAAFGESDKLGSNSSSANEVGRLLHQFDIHAGRYTFTGELLGGLPEFRHIRARLVLELLPKHGHSWATTIYWLGSLLVPLAVIGALICALIGGILLWA